MLRESVRRILDSCELTDEQRFVLVYDNTTVDIAAVFIKFAEGMIKAKVLSTFDSFNLDDYNRPLRSIPKGIRKVVLDSDLLVMMVSKVSDDHTDEHITFRKPLIDLKYENKKLRVGSILDVNKDLFVKAFDYKPDKLKRLNDKLFKLIEKGDEITIKTGLGTQLTMKIGGLTWINQDADLSKPSLQHSLLAGEVYGCPEDVKGVLVVDGILGGKFMRYGELKKTPLKLEILDSRIASVFCNNKELQEEFNAHLTKYDNSERVGELGFGTNTGLKKFYGVLGIDEKFPGNHIAFGHPYSEKTGADWSSPVHVDCVIRNCNTWIDDKQVLKDGKYLI